MDLREGPVAFERWQNSSTDEFGDKSRDRAHHQVGNSRGFIDPADSPRYCAYVYRQIRDYAMRDEAQPAARHRCSRALRSTIGRPSPVLKARLDHALDLYKHHLRPPSLRQAATGTIPTFPKPKSAGSIWFKTERKSDDIVTEQGSGTTTTAFAPCRELLKGKGWN
jgi:hypothetical protein